jgi:hypothetical protein
MKAQVRISAVNVGDVARVSAYAHGALACVGVVSMLMERPEMITFPVGVLLPVFHLNVNLNFPLPHNAMAGVFMAVGLILCYLISGAVTGAFLAVAFNLAAKYTGGVSASAFSIELENPHEEPAADRVTPSLP